MLFKGGFNSGEIEEESLSSKHAKAMSLQIQNKWAGVLERNKTNMKQ